MPTQEEVRPAAATPSGQTADAAAAAARPYAVDEKLLTCNICMELVYNAASVAPCNHNFCMACILKWSNSHPTCPFCRVAIRGISKNPFLAEIAEDYLQRNPGRQRSQASRKQADRQELEYMKKRLAMLPQDHVFEREEYTARIERLRTLGHEESSESSSEESTPRQQETPRPRPSAPPPAAAPPPPPGPGNGFNMDSHMQQMQEQMNRGLAQGMVSLDAAMRQMNESLGRMNVPNGRPNQQ